MKEGVEGGNEDEMNGVKVVMKVVMNVIMNEEGGDEG